MVADELYTICDGGAAPVHCASALQRNRNLLLLLLLSSLLPSFFLNHRHFVTRFRIARSVITGLRCDLHAAYAPYTTTTCVTRTMRYNVYCVCTVDAVRMESSRRTCLGSITLPFLPCRYYCCRRRFVLRLDPCTRVVRTCCCCARPPGNTAFLFANDCSDVPELVCLVFNVPAAVWTGPST